jgi:glycerol-3-phosphate cytidylyltransferase
MVKSVAVTAVCPRCHRDRPALDRVPSTAWRSEGLAMAGKTVLTFGTFDVLHVGHIRVLNRAAALGDRLVVGVSSDQLNFAKKGRNPVFDQNERLEIIANVKAVDAVFVEESLEQKREYVLEHRADVLVMGDDWKGKFDYLSDICEVVYLPRTPSVSTTAIIEHISSAAL